MRILRRWHRRDPGPDVGPVGRHRLGTVVRPYRPELPEPGEVAEVVVEPGPADFIPAGQAMSAYAGLAAYVTALAAGQAREPRRRDRWALALPAAPSEGDDDGR